MNILNYLNLSNPSNLAADSGYVFQKLLMKSVLRKRKSWKFYFLCSDVAEVIDHRVINLPLLKYNNKYQIRFSFHWDLFKSKLKGIAKDIDLVHMNQPEQTANLFALLSSTTTSCQPFISYYHYSPINGNSEHGIDYDLSLNLNGLGRAIFLKHLEAAHISKLNITCSNFGARLLEKSIQTAIAGDIAFTNIPPPVSFEEIQSASNAERFDKFTIVFNHRLYHHYGTEILFSWLLEYYKKHKNFQVFITDPTNGRSKERRMLDSTIDSFKKRIMSYPFVKLMHCKNRQSYYALLKKADCGIGPLRPSALWSMSVVDMMACRKPVLCIADGCFPEILGHNIDTLFCTHKQFSEKLESLIKDTAYYRIQARQTYIRAQRYDVENVAAKFIKVYERLAGGKI